MGEKALAAADGGVWFRGPWGDWEPDIPTPSTDAERETLKNAGHEVDNNDLPEDNPVRAGLRDLRFMLHALADGKHPNEVRADEFMSTACQRVGELAGADVHLGVPGVYRAALDRNGKYSATREEVREARAAWDQAVAEANKALDIADRLLSERDEAVAP